MTEWFVTSDGVKLRLDDKGTGRPMVFQHGLCGDAGQTEQVFPKDTGFRRITMECRAHGSSDAGRMECFSLAQFTMDLADMITIQRLDRPVVGGISMGAAISLRLAVTQPNLVGALVLARPTWGLLPKPKNMAPNEIVGELLERCKPELALAKFEASETARELAKTAPDNLASLRSFFRREPISVTSALLTRMSRDGLGISGRDLGELKMPVLVIGHEQDHVHPIGLARQLAAAIPGARFVEVAPKTADPERYRADFLAVLADFLKGL